jgi:hypothetical protein
MCQWVFVDKKKKSFGRVSRPKGAALLRIKTGQGKGERQGAVGFMARGRWLDPVG